MDHQITIYVVNILYLTCTPLFFGAFMEKDPRWNALGRILIFFGASMMFTASLYWVLDAPQINGRIQMVILLTRTAICLCIISLPYRGSVFRRAFSILILVMIFTLSEQIAVVLFAVFHNTTPGIVSQQIDYVYAIQGVSDGFAYTSVILIGLLGRRDKKLQASTRLYLLVSIIPLVSIVFSAAFFFSDDYVKISNPGTTMQIWAFIALINLLVYLLFSKLEEIYAKNQELLLEQQHYQLRDEYYQQIEAHQKEIRMIKHDLKNQLLALPVDSVIERLSEQTRYDFTGHLEMNALLVAKYQTAVAEDIICEFEARMPEDIRISAVDLVTLTGNLLDNAIEACRYCENRRYIRFRCVYANGVLIISSENSIDGAVNDFKTRKGDSPNHGLGIRSIKAAVEKYDGQMQYQFTSYYFTIKLTLFEVPITKS